MMRWTTHLLVTGALLVAFSALGYAKPASTPSGEPYTIGAIFSITGDASSLGIPERNTAQMMEKAINSSGGIKGHPLQIVIEEDRGEPAEALNAAKRLVEHDRVLAIIGPSRTGTTMALVQYMEKVQVPLISCAAGIEIVEPVNKWVFKTPQSDRTAVQKIVQYLKGKKITRVASLSDNTAFGKGGLREIEKLFPAAGITVVSKEEYGPKDTSMETQLTKIRGTNAQAVVCWGTPPGPAIVAKNMKQLGMRIPLICSHGVANATFLNLAGSAANGVVLPAGRLLVADQIPAKNAQKKLLQTYASSYQTAFGKPADTFGGHAWDAVQLLAKALREVGPDRARIRANIEQTKRFVGTGGIFNFSPADHNGLTQDAFVMIQVADGKWKLLK
ncbi:MAG: ABC transporter substrate-binding protein [Armatimonadota bacterium]|jgi:branched-chain amino acid transport system substrate-binding protein